MVKMTKTHHIFGIARIAALVILPLIAIVFINTNNTFATDLTVKRTGWESAPATEVYVPDLSKLSLNTAAADGYAYAGGNLELITADASWKNGNNQGQSVVIGNKVIVARPTSGSAWSANSYNVLPTQSKAVVVFRDVARYIDKNNGNKYNAHIVLTISNVRVATKPGSANTGLALFSDYVDMKWGSCYLTTTRVSNVTGSNEFVMGGSYDVNYKFYKSDSSFSFNPSTGAVSGTKLDGYAVVIGITDIDHIDTYHWQIDHDPSTPGNGFEEYIESHHSDPYDSYGRIKTSGVQEWIDYATKYDTTGEFAEAITYKSGFIENYLYLEGPNRTYLYPHGTNFGDNTRVVTRVLNVNDNLLDEQRKSGALTVMDAGDFTFGYSASGAAVGTGFLPTSKIATGITTSSDGISITSDQDEVFWKENVDIEISISRGWRLKELKLAAATTYGEKAEDLSPEAQDIDQLIASGVLEKVTDYKYIYHYTGVTKNQKIVAGAERNQLTICKQGQYRTSSSSAISGANMRLTRASGSMNFSRYLAVDSTTDATWTIDSGTQFSWTTGASGCILIGGLYDGTYTITETSAPYRYQTIKSTTITISGTYLTAVTSNDPSEYTFGSESLTFTDKRATGGLRVNKIIRGTSADVTDSFDFTLNVSPDDSGDVALTEIAYTLNGGSQTTAQLTNGSARFTITKDDTYLFHIPSGYRYTVTEDDYTSQGYVTTYQNQTGIGASNTLMPSYIINTKNFTPDTGIFGHGTGPIPFIVTGCTTATAGLWITLRVRKRSKAIR